MKYDIFISCKSEDYHDAELIYHYLTDSGLRVFLASIELRAKGRDVYGEIIDVALESADHMIIFASKADYVTTTYVNSEWRTFVEEKRAGRKNGNIITILKGVKVAELPIALRSFQSFTFDEYKSSLSYLRVEGGEPKPESESGSEPKPKPTQRYLWLAFAAIVVVVSTLTLPKLLNNNESNIDDSLIVHDAAVESVEQAGMEEFNPPTASTVASTSEQESVEQTGNLEYAIHEKIEVGHKTEVERKTEPKRISNNAIATKPKSEQTNITHAQAVAEPKSEQTNIAREQAATEPKSEQESIAREQATTEPKSEQTNIAREQATTEPKSEQTNIAREQAVAEPKSAQPRKIADNEIWYTSQNGEVIQPHKTDAFNVKIVSNTYNDGKGVITFAAKLTTIKASAFYNCDGLTDITMPNSITSIGESAFLGCNGLTSIAIPNSVTSIGERAFFGCYNLAKVTNGNGITSIGDYAFNHCNRLTSITIPEGTTAIGAFAFHYCSKLTSITIPESVTDIKKSAFNNCSSLTRVYCKAAIPPILDSGSLVFDRNSDNRKIYVPRASIKEYKRADGWRDYASDIVGHDF